MSSGPDATRPYLRDVRVPQVDCPASHRAWRGTWHGCVADCCHGPEKVLGLFFHVCFGRRVRGLPAPSCCSGGRPEQIFVHLLYLPSCRWARASSPWCAAAVACSRRSSSRCVHLHEYVEVVRECLDSFGYSPARNPPESIGGGPCDVDDGAPSPRHAGTGRAPVHQQESKSRGPV